jgi:hypothetical protein
MNPTLDGKWTYRSFRHEPIVLKNDRVDGQPDLALPWSPPGVLDVATDDTGHVKGTLTFSPQVVLTIEGRVIAGTDKAPPSVELLGEGLSSVNRIKGFFIPGSDHVVGTVMVTAHDLARQPNGTLGPFVLVPGCG